MDRSLQLPGAAGSAAPVQPSARPPGQPSASSPATQPPPTQPAATQPLAVQPPTGQPPADAAVPPRQLPVASGQTVQATVVAQAGDTVWLGYRGAVFAARAAFALEPGRSYDFVVARTEPYIELAGAVPGRTGAWLPAPATMRGVDLFAVLERALRAAAVPAGAAATGSNGRAAAELHGALQQLASDRPTAAALLALDRGLGHDQEARVLRLLSLPPAAQAAAAAELQRTAKAAALLRLAAEPAAAGPAVDPARLLVQGLGQQERDNAARQELGAPLWLPLPASPEAGLRDARMFLLGDRDTGTAGAAADDAFTIVLLLDLTQLGALRVDVVLRGERVAATFTTERADAAAALLPAFDALRVDLAEGGLTVDALRVVPAPRTGLPTADLALPPRDGSAMVDLHA